MRKINSEGGQIILILLLVMTVALAIGLSLVQRSITDISISTRLEESSRAFSAAEAGIEKALAGTGSTDITLENNSTANVTDTGLLPVDNQALEYPPLGKEEIAHVWLADPNADFKKSEGQYYNQPSIDVYWGSEEAKSAVDEEKPALEVTIVYKNSSGYQTKKYYLDPATQRTATNGFQAPDGSSFVCGGAVSKINTIFSSGTSLDRQFYCKANLSGLSSTLILLRARLLYSNNSHPFAVSPRRDNSCSSSQAACSLPRQVKIVLSKGSFGNTQRTIQLFKIDKVVPFYLDYAIFSSASISK